MATTNKLFIQFKTAADPAVWAHNCTINTSQDFTIEATTTDATAPDCDNPDAPSFVIRAIDTLSAGISGAGTMDPLSFAMLRELMLSGESFDVRVHLQLAKADGGGWFEGQYVMTSLSLAKEGKGFVSANLSLSSNGEILWVDASL